MSEQTANQVIRQLYAMLIKKRDSKTATEIARHMENEGYQRTFTDEYPFAKKSRAGMKKVAAEQKANWAALNKLG